MKTNQFTRDDVRQIADDLKIATDEDILDQVLEEYDNYCKTYPEDNWREIVETMLYNFTGGHFYP
jgi:hypothetical protein